MTPPPSIVSIVLAVAIVAALTGYFLGQAHSLGLLGARSSLRHPSPGPASNSDSNNDSDSGDDDDGADDNDAAAAADPPEQSKLILVVRTDLGMTKGKIAAQCSHATLACYKSALASPARLARWEAHGQPKIALQTPSLPDLLALHARARAARLNPHLIHDAGRTQVDPGSATVLGIGPAPKSRLDAVTGHLKLL